MSTLPTAHTDRIKRCFDRIKAGRGRALVTFITAGDPDPNTSLAILQGLPQAGADIIELGMPFSDPMADGPSIQAANLRALNAGMTLRRTLETAYRFRQNDPDTPVILMGYYNPIYSFGTRDFISAACDAGVDGLIVVDLPPEEDDELCVPARAAGLHWIRLVTPTTDDRRIGTVLSNVGGFLYYISVVGTTGARSADAADILPAIARLRQHTDLPIAVGFGIKTPQQAAQVAASADAVVVGSVLVDKIRQGLDQDGNARPGLVDGIHQLVRDLSRSVHGNTL